MIPSENFRVQTGTVRDKYSEVVSNGLCFPFEGSIPFPASK